MCTSETTIYIPPSFITYAIIEIRNEKANCNGIILYSRNGTDTYSNKIEIIETF